MKIAIIADIHHGPDSHNKQPGWNALDVLQRNIARAEALQADLLLDLGDHISDSGPKRDYQIASEVAEVFKTFNGKRVHLLGNHDVAHLSVEDNEAIYGESMQSQVHDLGDFRLIAWQPSVRIDGFNGLPAASPSLAWLIDALNADSRPAIIATHVPLSGHSQTGNFYFQNNSRFSTYPDYAQIRQAVEETGRAALWLAGHVHWNTVTTINNLPHITIQSMSERFTTFPQTAESLALLEIDRGQLSLEVMGNDPFALKLPFRASGEQHWVSPERSWTEADFAEFFRNKEGSDA